MRDYVIKRILLIVPTLFLVTVMVFLLVRFIPGDIVDMMATQLMMGDQTFQEVDQESIRNTIRERLGLDVPIYTQYVRWVGGIVTRLDFGESLWTGVPVIRQITHRLPWTIQLGFMAFIIAQLIAFPVGIYSAIRQNSLGDLFGRSFAIFWLAAPNFWLATMIIIFPAIWWGWSPEIEVTPFWVDPGKNLSQFFLPAFLMGTSMSAVTMRMVRTTMLDVLRQDYIRTAWAKGLVERVVVIRHALRNAMMPVITIIAGQLSILWGGSVIMETIFNIPGIGKLFLDSAFNKDYTYISSLNLINATIALVIFVLVDLAYAWLDPRLRGKAFK